MEDERQIIEHRFKKDLQLLKDQNQREIRDIAAQGTNVRNKNEKLQRVLIDKETELLRHQQVVTDLEAQILRHKEQAQLAQSKLKALEKYSSDLQSKYDKLV